MDTYTCPLDCPFHGISKHFLVLVQFNWNSIHLTFLWITAVVRVEVRYFFPLYLSNTFSISFTLQRSQGRERKSQFEGTLRLDWKPDQMEWKVASNTCGDKGFSFCFLVFVGMLFAWLSKWSASRIPEEPKKIIETLRIVCICWCACVYKIDVGDNNFWLHLFATPHQHGFLSSAAAAAAIQTQIPSSLIRYSVPQGCTVRSHRKKWLRLIFSDEL